MYNPKLVKKEIARDFFGVFTAADIKKDEIVFSNWNDNCAWLSADEVKQLPQPYKTIFEKYSTEIKEHVYVGPLENEDLCHQIEYFINHCCDPNVWLINDEDVVARRDIRAGEHITIDYATFIINEFQSAKIKKCMCGAHNCRGKLGREDWWNMRDVYAGHYISWIQKKIHSRESRLYKSVS
ncbi:MAG: SET domain-containing protein-lysine N-methyltransferase [Cytophagaceae bacterium]